MIVLTTGLLYGDMPIYQKKTSWRKLTLKQKMYIEGRPSTENIVEYEHCHRKGFEVHMVYLLVMFIRKYSLRSPSTIQWPFQRPKMEVPTIYKAYVRPM